MTRSLGFYLAPLCLALITLTSATSHAMEVPSQLHTFSTKEQAEVDLIKVLDQVLAGNLNYALPKAKALSEQYPNFHLAKLVYADLLSTSMGGGARISSDTQSKSLLALQSELKSRFQGQANLPQTGALPEAILKISTKSPFVIAVDFSQSRQYLFKNTASGLRLMSENYISIGKAGYDKFYEGDNRTPVGVYFTTRFLRDENLPELYGAGAFPTDYPNDIDRYYKKTGYGIWLHGVPRKVHSRPPLTSEGCVVMSNDRIESLKHTLPKRGIPVILSPKLNWLSANEQNPLLASLEQTIEQWRVDWESRDAEQFLRHYNNDFAPHKGTAKAWRDRKRFLAKRRNEIQVSIKNLELYRYPDSGQMKNLVLARFTQHYRADQYQDVTEKKQYWQQQADGNWEVLVERSQ